MKDKQDDSLKEYGGYKIGDEVFCKRHPDGKLGHGAISMIHIRENRAAAFTFGCSMTGAFRLAFFDDIIKNPTNQQMSQATRAKTSLYKSRTKPKPKKRR